MTHSLCSWLALREPADAAARAEALTRRLVRAIGDQRPLRIVDLGAGTGANARYLMNRLPRPQQWLLVDRDPALLARSRICPVLAGLVATRELDLGPVESLDVCTGCHLVTASALLDLVSERWLQALAARCRS